MVKQRLVIFLENQVASVWVNSLRHCSHFPGNKAKQCKNVEDNNEELSDFGFVDELLDVVARNDNHKKN